MKRLIFETIGLFLGFTLFVFIIGSLAGCTHHIEATTQTGKPLGHNRFHIDEGAANYFDTETIYIDTETGVQYLWVHSGNKGGLTVLVDHDGKPLIAEGFKDY